MPNSASIAAWLENLPTWPLKTPTFKPIEPNAELQSGQSHLKRRAGRLLSPPSEAGHRLTANGVPSAIMDEPRSAPKRRKLADHVASDARLQLRPHTADHDSDSNAHSAPIPVNDVTPRPVRRVQRPMSSSSRAPPTRRETAASRVTGTQSSASSLNRSSKPTSSPTRKLAEMSIDTDGITTRHLAPGDTRHPKVLTNMVANIYRWFKHKGVIGSSLADDFPPDLRSRLLLDDDAFSQPAGDTGNPGSTLLCCQADEVLEYATDCFDRSDSEMGWNFDVHHRLLQMVFRSQGKKRRRLVDFSPCQSALLIKEYLPTTATSKLVDFCVYLNPEAEADATEAHDYAEAIRQLQLNLPMRSINHTSYLPVASRPISLSLETKRTGKDSDEATLQIGTWHLAQWRMLRGLLTRTGGADHAQAALSELGVLPAIIVQGHKWSFAATTLEGTKTVLWSMMDVGSTDSLAGVYAIATTLEYLKRWSVDTFWEWYKRNVLLPIQNPGG
ncbi:Methyltransferase type 11 [Ophiocordyceps sinensis CO18]|uniref:Methyltransferase type 11 n=1 Tax=Ophiocordyceps sinensis (strain Co18 / CGMCC 3.14243) TaxID=911162 RepID=T5ANF3_OPHSC|nr:Methyltransferase type 11 [Ophiocordyceps sinensis CO18]